MKLVSLLFLCLGLAVTAAEAKYNPPAEGKVRSRSQEIAAYQMREFDEDGDGVLTVEEYEKRFDKLTREDRRNLRRANKEGNYMSPEEQFKAMDTDEDGKVSEEERAVFIRKMRDEGNYFY
ncbi:MAG: EF-hand domain-containing protein [Alphaproteobacteria bacterium]|nr:EF-hand domain-containing protein [Alphaproteobacteria bacterium]